jgi:hypothetical protein
VLRGQRLGLGEDAQALLQAAGVDVLIVSVTHGQGL